MISVASYMSVASGSNFNTGSTNSSNHNLEKKSPSNNSNEQNTSKSGNGSNTSISFSNIPGFEEEKDDPDNIDYYLKLKSKQSDVKFESISENFSSSSLTNTTMTKSNEKGILNNNDFQESFLKMLDTHNQNKSVESNVVSVNNKENQSVPIVKATSQTKSTTLNTNKKTLKPIETLPNLTVKSKAPIESKIKSLPDEIPKIADEKNPFLETEKNPFLEIDNNETIIKQSANEANYNPFLESVSQTAFDSHMLISSPPQLESTVKSISKTDSHPNNFNTSNTTKDLLEWCKDIIKKSKNYSPLFKNLSIKDFSSSWSNGLAFCAIIYHFKPDLM
jgi:hypothetical protein